ncbi:MAG: hypothetical protein AAB682_01215 [Patescibacteria group bacterium]
MDLERFGILILLLVVIGSVAFGGYYYFSAVPVPEQALKAEGLLVKSGEADTAGFINILVNLRTIKLDSKIFSDPAFSSLTDFGVAIAPQAVGRANPFAPLSGAVSEFIGGTATTAGSGGAVPTGPVRTTPANPPPLLPGNAQ